MFTNKFHSHIFMTVKFIHYNCGLENIILCRENKRFVILESLHQVAACIGS